MSGRAVTIRVRNSSLVCICFVRCCLWHILYSITNIIGPNWKLSGFRCWSTIQFFLIRFQDFRLEFGKSQLSMVFCHFSICCWYAWALSTSPRYVLFSISAKYMFLSYGYHLFDKSIVILNFFLDKSNTIIYFLSKMSLCSLFSSLWILNMFIIISNIYKKCNRIQ